MRLSFRIAPLLALVSLPLAAQYGVTDTGLKLQVRFSGGEWSKPVSNGGERMEAGQVGSGRAIDGLMVKHATVPVRMQVRSGSAWSTWVEPETKAGKAGTPITGLKMTAEGRSIRYRASFVGRGVGAWTFDGDAAEAGGAALEALEMEVLDAAPHGTAGFEYRVYFSGSGFTKWLTSGETAEAKEPDSWVTALQVRGPNDVKSEVYLLAGGWRPTTSPGEVAGDATGKSPILALRLYAAVPLQYRLKLERLGWGSWQDGALTPPPDSRNLRVAGVQLDLKRAR